MKAKRIHWIWSVVLWLSAPAFSSAQTPTYAGEFSYYAVASDHVLASQIGAQILAKGGNAADAAAATALALGVANPMSSGLGGGGFVLYYRACDETLSFLDFRERAPARATQDMYRGRPNAGPGPINQASQLGGLASAVPGEAAGLALLVKRFGSMSLAQVVQPAIDLAQRGVPLSGKLRQALKVFEEQLKNDPVMGTWLNTELLKRPALAKALIHFKKHGPRGFYRGRFARELVSDVKKAGGIISRSDLKRYRVVEREPLIGEYFGYRWVTAPPPSAGGFTLLQSLATLAERDSLTFKNENILLHMLAESWKGPFLDRQRYFGDPDFTTLPLQQMMLRERILQRARLIRTKQTTATTHYELPLSTNSTATTTPDNAGTSHLCVVDAHGNVAALTTTVNLPFGARYTAAGIVMNDEMDDFARALGEQNAFGLVGGAYNLPGPNKRPVSTMSPTIVFKDKKPVLCIGASGGSRIVTAVQQVAMRVLLQGKPLENAIRSARIHHQGLPDELRTERFAPLDPKLQKELQIKGHRIREIDNVAVVQAIHIGENLQAASDPRKGGGPAGR